MTCEDVVLALDHAHDGTMPIGGEVRKHVESCSSCGAYASFLANLPDRIAALPREMAPRRDLWDGIRNAIEPRVTGIASRRKAPRPTNQWWAAAAALIVGVGAGALWMKTQTRTTPTVSTAATATTPSAPAVAATAGTGVVFSTATPATPPTTNATAAGLPASYETGASEFTRATADLMAALNDRKNSMTPETRIVVEKNLAVIDAALVEIRAALAKDPNNRELLRMLGATRKRKIETLQLVVKLTA